ncbi:peptidoglycan DD-metalloendopeptidase family protein [Microbacterium sp. 179-I 3D4 NHS]|uniref:M23 family metallopeptidase n=1 Tax=Microbacterium sp. 179-I 3D4 NHS TaxID=3142381 RepID=UPI0039A2D119
MAASEVPATVTETTVPAAASAESPTPVASSTRVAPAAPVDEIVTPSSRRAARLRAAALAADETLAVDAPAEPIVEPDEAASVLAEPTPEPADVPAAPRADATTPMAEVLIDAFEQASQAFRGSSFRATETASATPASAAFPSAAEITQVAHRRAGRFRKTVTVGATVGVMSLAGLLAVSMTLPAEALAAVQGTSTASTSLVAAPAEKGKKSNDEIQAFVTSSDVQNASLTRTDNFSTISLVEVAAEQGINYSNEVFTNDPEAAIQWPFLVGVGMSYGYGMRSGRLHEGIDFVPGNGAPVQAIADGTVRIATEQGGAYGVTVYIDHVIDGEVITSHYAHMQYGSLQVKTGDTVKVGTTIGKTGNTGRSYGAHMHFELIVNGSTIDPLPWLRANAGRYEY